MTESDRSLAHRFLTTRDEATFLALYDRHTPVMYRCALRRTGSVEAAENAVQEAWLRAMRGLGGFEWRSALRSWLVGITLNCCREAQRRRLRVVNHADEIDHETAASEGAGRVGAAPARIDLEQAVATLPPGGREVLLLHDVEGLTHEEIAEALGIAPGTSKSQLSRARAHVRRALTLE